MPGTHPTPLSGPIPATIPLKPPPLAKVFLQVRFSPMARIVRDEFFADFQEALADEYPSARKEHELFLPAGPAAEPQRAELWRMRDQEDHWKLTLATAFVTLETDAYPGKDLFFQRLARVLEAVGTHVEPRLVERVGVRYICRLEQEDDLVRLPELVRPEVVGVAAVPGAQPKLLLTQSQYPLEEHVWLVARWGIVPPNLMIDPGLPGPENGRSWILDVDVYEEVERPFDAEALRTQALRFSRLQYRFFRWAIEPAFLLRFGADPELVNRLEV
jgi:uncharacterized protein (TIGR04255 family)